MSRNQRTVCAVLGDGGWGTALAIHLHRLGHRVRWWGAFPAYLRVLDRTRANRKFLPGIPIPKNIRITPDLSEAIHDAQCVILAIPSQHLRGITRTLKPFRRDLQSAILVSVAKGLEQGSLLRMSQVIHDELGAVKVAALSGPSIAAEVARQQPASLVAAAHNASVATTIQRWCMGPTFRIYTSTDVAGVELGGALKNPIAIAAGVSDGLGFGANAKAALVTRGIVEMARLGVACGAREQTFWGLSGLGDLVTTCLSGRNHWLGEQLGKGRRLRQILASTPMVIEGVETSTAALTLARHHGVELPLIEQVHRILFRNQSPRNALQALMRRAGKAESS